MKTYTVFDVMAARPCHKYPESRVCELWAGRDALIAREIAGLEIPVKDRLWALIYMCLDDRRRRLLACDCASEALGRLESPDPRSLAAVEVARRYTRGEATDGELGVASTAAISAASTAASAAASAAAWAAIRAVASAVASDVAWYAAWYAARTSASAFSSDAAWDRYLAWAVAYAEKKE